MQIKAFVLSKDGAKDEDETNVNTYFICLHVCHRFSGDIFNVLARRCRKKLCVSWV